MVDIDDKAVVYSPDGKVVYTEQGYLQINSKYMIDRHAGQSVIMDAQGNQLYSTDISTSVLHYDSDYFTQRENNMTTVINAKGEPVTTPVFCYKNVFASYTHLYSIEN